MTDPSILDLVAHTGDPAWLKANGLMVAEGRIVVRRLLAAGDPVPVAVCLAEAATAAMMPVIMALPEARRPQVLLRTQAELDALTGFRLHQGCVAFAHRPAVVPWAGQPLGEGVCVLLERVRDPDNVGSTIRSAAAMGVRHVFIGPECADPYYRKAIRTSMGAVFSVRLWSAEPWPGVLAALDAAGCQLVATTPDLGAETVEAVAAGLDPARPIVVLVGSEGEGLTAEARGAVHRSARIPMAGGLDSLNASVAAAIAVYAFTRRERNGG